MLRDRVAIITGGARGIGRSIAERYAEHGAKLVIVDVIEEVAEATVKELQGKGIDAIAVKTDVSNSADVDAMVEKVIEHYGKIDILVNNAGITRDGLLMRMDDKDWDMVININLKGVFLCTRAVVRHMSKARSGSIINMASIVGQMGNAGQANYSASKGGVIALTKTTAKEFAARGVRANAIAPGFIQTEMTDKLPDQARKTMLDSIPMKNMGQPGDVADGALFLASDMSAYITGHVLAINGGMLM